MKKITEIKAVLHNKYLLSSTQMLKVKGGEDTRPTGEDDKRRERPGGGVSTQ